MPKPHCRCDGRTDIRCDGKSHCDIAGTGQGRCKLCWQAIYSPPHRRLWGIDGDALPAPPSSPAPPLLPAATKQIIAPQPNAGIIRLGDRVESALSAVGVTKERVSRWLGAPCNCTERQRKLNALSAWVENATRKTLDKLLGD